MTPTASKWPDDFDVLATSLTDETETEGVHAATHNSANAAVMAMQKVIGLGPPFDLSGMVEDIHVVGEPGEPDWITGKENPDGTGDDVPAFSHSEEEPVYFYKDPFGRVHLGGMMIFNAARRPPPLFEDWETAAYEQRAFILPEGYRPAQKVRYTSTGESGDPFGASHGVEWWLGVFPDGTVADLEAMMELDDPGRGSLSTPGYGFMVDGLSFPAVAP